MYKLLALDMEDTFLDSRKVILEPVEQGIRQLLHKGIDVTFASGRFPASLWLHAKFLGLRFPLIALNGAALVDPIAGTPLENFPLESEISVKIANFAAEQGLYLQFYGYNTLFVEELNEFNRQWPLKNVVMNPDKELTFDNYRGQANSIGLLSVKNLARYVADKKAKMLKAVIIDKNEHRADKAYEEMRTWPELTVTRTGLTRFDINGRNISKKTTLEYICNKRGISSEEVVAAGYFDNDIEMIRWAGLGIAMGDAHQEVKQAADFITDTNDRAGIARAISEIFSTTPD